MRATDEKVRYLLEFVKLAVAAVRNSDRAEGDSDGDRPNQPGAP